MRTTVLATLALAISLTSCASPKRLPAVPRELSDRAEVPGMKGVRTWGNRFDEAFVAEIIRAASIELDTRKAAGQTGPLPPASFLAISGGGANGAYGAGLLCGWTAAGNRPEFKVVTGISTGALTAPFAFLGSKYDDQLRQVYTKVTTKEILTPRNFTAALFDDALMDTAPLWRLLRTLVNEEMMREIAAEYAKGRILLVGTTNLDAQRGVIWNIGAIASSGDPNALQLIHSILIASAAIPAAFPPVMIDVVADGKHYHEMHVDGGTRAQVFLYPPSFKFSDAHVERERRAYVIRNARLDPYWADVQRRTLPIAARAIDSLIQTQGIGDLYRMYLLSQRDKVDFNLAYIPETFSAVPKEDFDPVYMKQLFDVGFAAAKGGYPWSKKPPGYAEEDAPVQSSQP